MLRAESQLGRSTVSSKYQVCVNRVRHKAPFDRLADAKAAGRTLAEGGASVHIEIYPPITNPPTPMGALRFDPELQNWVTTTLPL